MYCLSEVGPSQKTQEFTRLRTHLESQLKQWLLFECKVTKRSRLAGEMEFPEPILKAILGKESEDVKIPVVESLATRPKISPTILELAASWLSDNVSKSLKLATLGMLQRPHEALPEEVLKAVAERLRDTDGYVRDAAAYALGRQPALPEEILKAVAERLGDTDANVRSAATEALVRQPALPEEILKAVVERLGDTDANFIIAATEALDRQPALPREILKAVAERLGDTEWYVRETALDALGRLPEEILKAVAERLEDTDANFRGGAVDALGQQVKSRYLDRTGLAVSVFPSHSVGEFPSLASDMSGVLGLSSTVGFYYYKD